MIVKKKSRILEHLERIANLVPVIIYWLDVDQKYFGVNKQFFLATGTESYEKDLAGKTPYNIYPKEMAEDIVNHHRQVLHSGERLSAEESIRDVSTREIKYFNATIDPLRDDDGSLIGTIGVSVETTAQKEADSLRKELIGVRLENELQKAKLQEQEKFKTIVNQAAHDIRSPLASMMMIVKAHEKDLPETALIALKEGAISIGNVTEKVFSRYLFINGDGINEEEKREPLILPIILQQVLNDKKSKYKDLPITFEHSFFSDFYFTFINAQPIAFRKIIVNLINNAVAALEGRVGKVSLKLDIDNDMVKIIIEDSGKGMSPEVINNIMNFGFNPNDKKDGKKTGFVQIMETLNRNQGQISIDSEIGKGSKVTLFFPRVPPPTWVADTIHLSKGDTVVVLDDDSSSKSVWRERFKPYENRVHLELFKDSKEAIKYINNIPSKDKVLFVSDFELLREDLNGLCIIEKIQPKHSILVTGHYTNQIVRDLAAKTSTKILPKELVQDVRIKVSGI